MVGPPPKEGPVAGGQEPRDTELALCLLAGAFCAAPRQGAGILQVTGFSRLKRLVLEEHRPRPTTPGANWPYFYKARHPIMRTVLRQPDSWDPCLYDGDAALVCL